MTQRVTKLSDAIRHSFLGSRPRSWALELTSLILSSPGEHLVCVHTMPARNHCHRIVRLQRLSNDLELLLDRAPLAGTWPCHARLRSPNIICRSVHLLSMWTLTLVPTYPVVDTSCVIDLWPPMRPGQHGYHLPALSRHRRTQYQPARPAVTWGVCLQMPSKNSGRRS